MKRVRVAIWGAGGLCERGLLPVLSGPDAFAPPDAGPGWARRPAGNGELRYQPPAVPEVVALCDEDALRLNRVADAARVRARYADPRALLREAAPDALFIVPGAASGAAALPVFLRFIAAKHPTLRVWLAGPPALSSEETAQLAHDLGPRAANVWLARLPARALAYRAARRAVASGEIGPVAALSLRWNAPFSDGAASPNSAASPNGAASSDAARRVAGAFAALSLLLEAAAWRPQNVGEKRRVLVPAQPLTVAAHAHNGALSLWLRCAGGATATALFAAADGWSSGLPRLEACGTEGRFIVCEGGRRVALHGTREPARLWEPPGASLGPSASDVAGIAPDARAFLAECVGEAGDANHFQAAARTLRLVEAALESARSGALVRLDTAAATPSDAPPLAAPDAVPDTPRVPRPVARPAVDAPTLPL